MNLYIRKHTKLSFKKSEEMTEFYRSLQIDYPKFFKMDNLSKLGFLASELILNDFADKETGKEDMAIVLWNRSSSLDTDSIYQKTIQSAKNYYPSPSVFVYTLPSIVVGEIAIRNKICGETAFYISEKWDAQTVYNTVFSLFLQPDVRFVLCGWVECFQENYETIMYLVTTENEHSPEFTIENITKIDNYK